MKNPDLIYGIRPLTEALLSGKGLDKVLMQRGLRSEGYRELLDALRNSRVPVQYVPVEKLNGMVRGNHQGVVGLVKLIDYAELHQLIPTIYESGEDPFILVLDRITDVRNFGALARTAECAGVHAIVVPETGAARTNAISMKASSGALSKIPVCREQRLIRAVEYLRGSGLTVVACTEKGSRDYSETDYRRPLAIVMGSEEDGISSEILSQCDEKVNIPMAGSLGSLNVSVAAGIILFEALRQKRKF